MDTTRVAVLAFGLAIAGSAPAQHLGDVICKADAAFVGTIVAMKALPAPPGRSAVALNVSVEQRLKGPAGPATLELTLEGERLPVHLHPDTRRVFLLQSGKLFRIEPEEHIGITRKLLADKSHCAPR